MNRLVMLLLGGVIVITFIVVGVVQQATKPPVDSTQVTALPQVPGLESGHVQPSSEGLGKKLFSENCAMCHGHAGQGNPMVMHDHLVRFDSAEVQKTLTDEYIKQVIRKGKGMMPPFESSLDDEDMNALVKYVRTLAPTQSPS